jgi:hypothetical protein
MSCTACTEPQCLYSTAIPLLPLWTVRSVQSLSPCPVHLYLHSPHLPYALSLHDALPLLGRKACTEPQCLYSIAIPLLPLLAVRSVQSLSACTVKPYLYSPYEPYRLYKASVPVRYSYTSTPPIGRTACTDRQSVEWGAIALRPP